MSSNERSDDEPPRDAERGLDAGERFGRYVIERVVGEGGMGRVYGAMDTLLERRVALKVILPSGDKAHAAVATARLLREAKAVAALDHPNVVAIFDVGELDGVSFIAMELIQGRSLRSFVASRSPGWQERLRWLVDVARALSAAHQVGLIHRDIKPDNVMIRDDGRVKVLDFGIARRASSPAEPMGNLPVVGIATITADGVQIGTPLYMAPEQVRAEPLDAKSDQFSWGVMAYELLGGVPPWSGDVRELMRAILVHEPRHLRAVRPGIPEGVAAVVMQALAKRPTARWSSMISIITALQPFVGSELVTATEKADIKAPDGAAADPHAATVKAGPTAPDPLAATVKAGPTAPDPHAATVKAGDGAVTNPPETPVRPEQTPASEPSPSPRSSFHTPPLASASPTDPIPQQALAPPEPSSRRRWLLRAAGVVGAISVAGVLALVVSLRSSPSETAPQQTAPQQSVRTETPALRCAPATVTGEADPAVARALGLSACARLGIEVGVPWGDTNRSVPVVNTNVVFGPDVEASIEVREQRATGRGSTPIEAVNEAVMALAAMLTPPALEEREIKAWGAKDEASARRIERAWRRRSLWLGGDGSADARSLLQTDAGSPIPHLLTLMSATATEEAMQTASTTAESLAGKLSPARQSMLKGVLLALPKENNRTEAARLLRIAYADAPEDADIAAIFSTFAVQWDLPEGYGALDRLTAAAPTRSLWALESALTRVAKRDLDRIEKYAAKIGEIFPEARATPSMIRVHVTRGRVEEARSVLTFARTLGLDKAPADPLVYADSALEVELFTGNAAEARRLSLEILGDPSPYRQVLGGHGVASSHLLEGQSSTAEAVLWENAERHRSVGNQRAAVPFAIRALSVRRLLKQRPMEPARLHWLRVALGEGSTLPPALRAEGLVEVALAQTGLETFRVRTDILNEVEVMANGFPASEVMRRREILVKTIPLIRTLRGDRFAIERWWQTEGAPFASRLRPAFDAAFAMEATGDLKGALGVYQLAADPWNLREGMLERVLAIHRLSKLLPRIGQVAEGAVYKKSFETMWGNAEPAARQALELIR
jgi:serine/threonine-protein kinase